jgi:hypothetical protein
MVTGPVIGIPYICPVWVTVASPILGRLQGVYIASGGCRRAVARENKVLGQCKILSIQLGKSTYLVFDGGGER